MSESAPDLGPDGPAAVARLRYDAMHRGRVVARAVASTPVDHYARAGQITERQHEAAVRLRAALELSWPQTRVTASLGYLSNASEYDEEGVPLSDEEREARRIAHYRTWREAERVVGPQFWPTLRGVCSGMWATQHGGIPTMRAGLQLLADFWKIPA